MQQQQYQATSAQQQQSGQQQPSGAPNGVAGGAQMPQANLSPGVVQDSVAAVNTNTKINGGRFDFDDGGVFCGGWEDGKAHGHGVCTGPKGQGAYSGSWNYGFEVSGVYTWPSGSAYEGQWQNGKRHGLGMETRGRWLYRGEWTQGFKGRYGVRQSTTSTARYEGTWAAGLQDGYGSETYADSGTYQGQWLRGMRHGYGVRASAPFGLASHYKPPKQVRASLTSLRSADGAPPPAQTPEPTDKRDRRVDDSRGGFVLKAKSDETPARRKSLTEKSLKKGILSGLKIRKQKSTGDLEKRGTGGSIRSNASSASWISTESSQSQASASVHTDSNASFVIEDEQMDASVTETYLGEWKNDKRTGFGISERSDGLRYEGEWFNNRKYGYGVTTFRDGTKEEGKYKNNVLITSQKKKHLFLIRSAKFRERIDAACSAAQRASKIALQKADIAISRTATARGKAELADIAAEHAREDSELALQTARQFAPDFRQPGLERLRNREIPKYVPPPQDTVPVKSILHKPTQEQGLSPPSKSTSSPSDVDSNALTPNQGVSTIRRPSMKLNPTAVLNQNQIPSQIPPSQTHSTNLNPMQNQYPQQYNQLPQNQLLPNEGTAYQPQAPGYFAQPMQNNHFGQSQFQNPSQQINMGYNNYSGPQIAQGYPNQFQQGFMMPQVNATVDYGNNNLMNQYNKQQNYAAQQFPAENINDTQAFAGGTSLRRNSRVLSPQDKPEAAGQSLNDRLDHYKRPPSRDSSVDRYTRAHSRLMGSRQPSVDKISSPPPTLPQDVLDRSVRGASAMRAGTPLNGSAVGSGAVTPTSNPAPTVPTSRQFEGALIKNRSLGQDILPSPGQPKRTESLYVTPGRGSTSGVSGGTKAIPVASVSLQRKKSLPDVAQPFQLNASAPLTREEVSILSSMRREEVRRQIDERERLRANPLLYLVSPQVKDWFSRQQLVMLVLFINISLALMFFKLLT